MWQNQAVTAKINDGLTKYQRYRLRHPERVRKAQRVCDSKPERKECQKLRVREKRKTENYKIWKMAYEKSPNRIAKRRAASKTEKSKAYHAAWRKRPEHLARRAERMRAYRETPAGKLENRMRVAIRRGLNRNRSVSLEKTVGYSIAELKTHLERQFLPGMSWDNSREWHIDHVIPLSRFAIVEYGDREFLAAWALTNLMPLWALDNLKKRNEVRSLL